MTTTIDDIVIAGGGIVGLALALALVTEGCDPASLRLLDPGSPADRPAPDRAYAVTTSSRRLLERVGVWQRLAAHTQPVHAMAITVSRLADPVRPVLLDFSDEFSPGDASPGEFSPGEPLAHLVEEQPLVEALRARAAEAGVPIERAGVADVVAGPASLRVRTIAGEYRGARLLAAADGAGSICRLCAGISTVGHDYHQRGIVVTVTHERDHGGRAIQHFLPSGPFAMLPLTGRRSSVVWTEDEETARHLVDLPAEDFREALERRFGHTLGRLVAITAPRAFPLRMRIARDFVADRLVLLGDAAHVVHPIAGQGLNLGLADVSELAGMLGSSLRLGLDPGDPATLARWQRRRRPAVLAMAAATDGLLRLFSNDMAPIRLLRDLGLGLVQRSPGLKRAIVAGAAGPLAEATEPLADAAGRKYSGNHALEQPSGGNSPFTTQRHS